MPGAANKVVGDLGDYLKGVNYVSIFGLDINSKIRMIILNNL